MPAPVVPPQLSSHKHRVPGQASVCGRSNGHLGPTFANAHHNHCDSADTCVRVNQCASTKKSAGNAQGTMSLVAGHADAGLHGMKGAQLTGQLGVRKQQQGVATLAATSQLPA